MPKLCDQPTSTDYWVNNGGTWNKEKNFIFREGLKRISEN